MLYALEKSKNDHSKILSISNFSSKNLYQHFPPKKSVYMHNRKIMNMHRIMHSKINTFSIMLIIKNTKCIYLQYLI